MRSSVLLLFLLCSSALADVQADLTKLRPSRLGRDRAGTLWSWSTENATVTTLPDKGKPQRVVIDDRALVIDVDRQFGVVSLGPFGKDLVVTGWGGKKVVQTPLPFAAGNVCWLDKNRLALAPLFGKARVVIWNLSEQRPITTIGEAIEIDEHKPGARVARATLLRYDAPRDEIVTVDAYYGTVAGYTSTGKPLRATTVRHPNQAATDDWLRNLDQQYKQEGTPFRPLMWSYPTLALDETGTAWLGEASTDDAVALVGVARDGSVVRKTFSSKCPSVRFELSSKSVLLYRDPQSPRPYCVEERRLHQ
jgi:hypothetical protein